jgi:uncharacterized protein YqeY
MATPKERIEREIREALKAGDKQRLATLRLLLTSLQNERIRTGSEVDDDGFIRLVQKSIKQRRDSAEQYRKGGREDLVAAEEAEEKILETYLPPPVDDRELEDAVRVFLDERQLSGPAAIGPVMKEMLSRYSGRADGAKINGIVRKILAQLSE